MIKKKQTTAPFVAKELLVNNQEHLLKDFFLSLNKKELKQMISSALFQDFSIYQPILKKELFSSGILEKTVFEYHDMFFFLAKTSFFIDILKVVNKSSLVDPTKKGNLLMELTQHSHQTPHLVEALKLGTAFGMDLHYQSIIKETPLFSALKNKNMEAVELFLAQGANPNQQIDHYLAAKHQWTPLYQAISSCPKAIPALLHYGADPKAKCATLTPLIFAKTRNNGSFDILVACIQKLRINQDFLAKDLPDDMIKPVQPVRKKVL